MHNPEPARSNSLYFTYEDFPFRRPIEMEGARTLYDVAIVGGGPVGLVTALELARHGVRAVVLEPKRNVSEGSRALAFSRRSQEILHGLGVSEPVHAKALAWTRGRTFYRGDVIFRLEMPHSVEERFGPMINLQQCYLEKFLVDRVRADDSADLRWRSKVIDAVQDNDKVTLTVDTPEGEYSLDARYVVAADGARSVMRSAFGLGMSGQSHEGTYLIADIKIDSALPTERHAWFDPPSNPGATMLMHKQPDGLWRVDYQPREDQDPEVELRPERVKQRIQSHLDWIGEPAPWELEMSSLYKAHCICLDDYRHGRVFFAGDAAHLVPIFGVRGLNSGIADANNIGWKLAAALSGKAPDALLDSYSSERRPATLEIFEQAGKSTAFMTPPSRGYRLMRDAALSLALKHAWAGDLANPRQSQPYDYEDSALNAETHDDAMFEGGPRVGAPFLDTRLADGRHLTDILGVGATLLCFEVASGLRPEGMTRIDVRQSGASAIGLIIDTEGALFKRYDARAGTCYLLRPDGHVAGRWRRFNLDLIDRAMTRLFGGDGGRTGS